MTPSQLQRRRASREAWRARNPYEWRARRARQRFAQHAAEAQIGPAVSGSPAPDGPAVSGSAGALLEALARLEWLRAEIENALAVVEQLVAGGPATVRQSGTRFQRLASTGVGGTLGGAVGPRFVPGDSFPETPVLAAAGALTARPREAGQQQQQQQQPENVFDCPEVRAEVEARRRADPTFELEGVIREYTARLAERPDLRPGPRLALAFVRNAWPRRPAPEAPPPRSYSSGRAGSASAGADDLVDGVKPWLVDRQHEIELWQADILAAHREGRPLPLPVRAGVS